MIGFNGSKVKDVPKIILVWVNGYMVWPDKGSSPYLPPKLVKKVRSCFALGEWYNYFYWTNLYAWSNNIQEALNYFNELYGTDYELLIDED